MALHSTYEEESAPETEQQDHKCSYLIRGGGTVGEMTSKIATATNSTALSTAQSGEQSVHSRGSGGTAEKVASLAHSDDSLSTGTDQQEKLRNAFSNGKVQDVVQVLCRSADEHVQILAHVSTRTRERDGDPHVDKRYVVRVTSNTNGTTKYFYVHLKYTLPLTLPLSGLCVRNVHLRVREALTGVSIRAPSGGLVFDKVWKPDSNAESTASGNKTEQNLAEGESHAGTRIQEIYAHNAIMAPVNAFNRRVTLENTLNEVSLAQDTYNELLTDAYVYQNTAILHKDADAGISVESSHPHKVMEAVASTLYYADAPDVQPTLTRVAEYSTARCGRIMDLGSGDSGNDVIERHYVFTIGNQSDRTLPHPPPNEKIHAFVSTQFTKEGATAYRFAARPVAHDNTFALSRFLAASRSRTPTSAEKQQFVIHGKSMSLLPTGNNEDGGSTAQSGEQSTQHGTGQATSNLLPIIVVNNHEKSLEPISDDTPQQHVKYLEDVIKRHATSEEMNEALVASLLRISLTSRDDLKRADDGFAQLLQNNNVEVNGIALTDIGSSDALSALRSALNWKSGASDLLLRAVINTCDTTYNGFTVVNSDGTLNRIQPVIQRQKLNLRTNNSATPGSKAEVTRDLWLNYKINSSTLVETRVRVQYELSLRTREDGRTMLQVSDIQATANSSTASSRSFPIVAPATLSYPWYKNEVASDLSQPSATPSLAIIACICQHGLESAFLPLPNNREFSLTKSAAKKSISKFYSSRTGATNPLNTISDQMLRKLGLQLFRQSGNNLEISRLLSAVSKHLAATVCKVEKTSDKATAIHGEGEDVVAGTRVEQDYRMSMQGSAEDMVVRVVYDVLLVESGFTDKKTLSQCTRTDFVVCNLEVGCAVASQASGISMMEFPVPMMTVWSQEHAVPKSVANPVPSVSGAAPVQQHGLWLPSGKLRNEQDIARTLNTRGAMRAVLFPQGVSTEQYTSHVISRMAEICLGCSNSPSPIIKNISSNTIENPQEKSYRVVKTADVSVEGSSDVFCVSVEYVVSKKTHRQPGRSGSKKYVCRTNITGAKLTISKKDADGVAQTSATFKIHNTQSQSVSTPYQNARIECIQSVQQHQEAESVQQEDDVLTPRTQREGDKAERNADKRAREAVFAVKSSNDSKKKKQCCIIVLLWWFVGLLARLWACIVAVVSFCCNLTFFRCGSLGKTDNSAVTLLRDFTTLQRTAEKSNTRDSGAEEFENHAHLLRSSIDGANETQEDVCAQEDAGPPLAAVATPEVRSHPPGSVLDDSEVTDAVAYNYSSAAVSGV